MNAHKKVQNATTAIVLSVAVVLSVFLTAFQTRAAGAVSAAGDFSQFVTSYGLTVKDSNNNSSTYYLTKDSAENPPDVTVQDGTTVTLEMNFSVPSGSNVEGNSYAMQLPAALKATSAQSGQLTGGLGSWKVDINGLLTVTFDSNTSVDENGGEGGFACWSTFSAENVEGDSHTVIPFKLGGATVNVPVTIYFTEVDPTLVKTGSLQADGSVLWTVTVTSGNDGSNGGLKDVVVTDTIDDTNQDFDFSTAAPKWGSDEVKDSSVTTAPPWYDVKDSTTVDFHLGDMAHDQTKKLTFTTKPKGTVRPQFPDTGVVYRNTATLGADGLDPANLDLTKKAEVPDNSKSAVWITKSVGSPLGYDGTDERMVVSVPWKITVNKDGKGDIGAGATVTDTLQSSLMLDESVGLFVGTTRLTTTPSAADPWYEYTGGDANGYGGKITIHFPQAVSGEQDVTFTTKVDKTWYETANQQSISNGASLSLGGDSTGAGNVGSGVYSEYLAKTGTGYTPATHLATWDIRVGYNGIAMTNPIVTDTWGKDASGHSDTSGQKFYSITAKTTDGTVISLSPAADLVTVQSTPRTYYADDTAKTVTVHLPDFAANDPAVVLTVTTEVMNPAYFGINKQNNIIYNSAALNTEEGIGATVGASNTVNSTVLTKNGSYDYNSRTLTWNLTVNQNKMPMMGAVVADMLPTGTGLTLGSVTMKKTGTETEDTAIPRADGDTGSYLHYTLVGQTLTIYLGDAANSVTITIMVTEDVSWDFLADSNNNKDITVANSASLRYTELGGAASPTANASATIRQSIVEKSGNYNSNTNQLDWQVKINKNQIPVGSLNIPDQAVVNLSDTLQAGLALNPSSVHLYYLTASGGTWAKGAEISLTLSDAAAYNPITRLFTFTFPSGTDFGKGYELDFSTDIVSQQGDATYSNTVTMAGVAKNPAGGSSDIKVSQQAYSGWFTSHQSALGSITVTKRDQDTNQLIPGTEFTLYQNGTAVQTTKTGSDGVVKFSNLKTGASYSYTVKETAPAAGYQPNSTVWGPYTLSASDSAQQNLTATFYDRKTAASSSESSSEVSSTPDDSSSSQPDNSGSTPDGGSSSQPNNSSSTPGGGHTPGGGGGTTTSSSPNTPSSTSSTPDSSAVSSGVPSSGGTLSIANSTPSGGAVLTGQAALYIKKVNKNGQALSGAEFTLFDANGKALQKKVTDSSGIIAFKNLPAGDYAVKETKAPAGYELYSAELNVTLLAGQQAGYTLRDNLKEDDTAVLGWTSDNTLPKTGEVPIAPIAAACGLMLICLGIVVRRRVDLHKNRMKHLPK